MLATCHILDKVLDIKHLYPYLTGTLDESDKAQTGIMDDSMNVGAGAKLKMVKSSF